MNYFVMKRNKRAVICSIRQQDVRNNQQQQTMKKTAEVESKKISSNVGICICGLIVETSTTNTTTTSKYM